MFRVQGQRSYINRGIDLPDCNVDSTIWAKAPSEQNWGSFNVTFNIGQYERLKPKHIIRVYNRDGIGSDYIVSGWMLKWATKIISDRGDYWVVPYLKNSALVPNNY